MIQPISPDQWTVIGWDANHRQRWSAVVRASTEVNAVRVACRLPSRPKWVSFHTMRAELRTAANDPTIREMIRDGFVREGGT